MNIVLRKYLPLICAAAIFALDRLLKYFAIGGHSIGNSSFGFSLFKNQGLVFSLPTPYPVAVILMLLGLAAIVIMYFRLRGHATHPFPVWAAAFMGVGALSNVLDRVNLGYIVDYVWLGKWSPIFNVADIALIAGLIILIFFPEKKSGIDKTNATS